MKKINAALLLIALIALGCKSTKHPDLGDGIFADIETNKGEIVLQLYYGQTPVTVANFISLAEGTSPFVSDSLKGKKYYDGVTFHRVIKDFMIQGGDPSGTGRFGPGYKFEDEIVDTLGHDSKGILSMANAGPNTNGSQFFITHVPTPQLNGRHAVFGKVVKGIEVVDSIANVKTSPDANKPLEDVVMDKVTIIRNGKEANAFNAIKVMTNYFDKVNKREGDIKKVADALAAEFKTQQDEAEELPSGLKILYLNKAEGGQKPKEGDNVMVNYAGFLDSGMLFDSNELSIVEQFHAVDKRRKQLGGYAPIPMLYGPDSPLIAGFREGLLQMKVGDKARLFIPSHLGYGEAGAGGVIPPNADLVFDVEITEMAD
ncbi:peptidylprolyl isomerase [Sinomicrobium weinanense]|uniref:peptidylprolyl isomerase n=1 Tax=Sinomicrobium weinanense TaxID=2842200 RepID=A0A926Q300_9FLAO|nr:peptidylprolyl isomerase [Sinomicrobium weinanense]MBC9797048.1 peptidylprolyl isomerase [Sinomicrobium weinanense]MBU3122043.1 peptidylprolyl isomerase [Sinomicrobium weinanense]